MRIVIDTDAIFHFYTKPFRWIYRGLKYITNACIESPYYWIVSGILLPIAASGMVYMAFYMKWPNDSQPPKYYVWYVYITLPLISVGILLSWYYTYLLIFNREKYFKKIEDDVKTLDNGVVMFSDPPQHGVIIQVDYKATERKVVEAIIKEQSESSKH